MSKSRIILLVAVVCAAIAICIGLFPRQKEKQVDYGVRIEDQQGDFTLVQCELPKIGPYAATGGGIPPKNWKPVEGQDLVVDVQSILQVTADMEVTEGDSVPVAVTTYFSSRRTTKNLYYDHVQVNTFHSKFKEQWVAEKSGELEFNLHCPKVVGKYRLFVCHHELDGFEPIILAQLDVTVK